MKRIWVVLCLACILLGCSKPVEPTVPYDPSESITSMPEESTVPDQTSPSSEVPSLPTEPTDPLTAILQNMTLEERVGQIFLARCPSWGAVAEIEKYHLGGYVLFARDFQYQTPNSISTILQSYQSASKIPMLIAVDEEGGTVTRVSRYPAFRSTPFPSPRTLYAQGGMDAIRTSEAEKFELLSSIGLNVNLAPVCDITTDPASFMYKRSLGESPEITGEFVKAVIEIADSNHIGAVLKHFPGYGNNTDTHIGIAVDNRPLAQLEQIDLIPFASGIEAGCDAIMVSHVLIHAIDPELPATLSPSVHDYLRSKMGFDRVIITDDLAMQAITDVYGVGEAAVMAVLAGNDLLCVSNYAEQYEAVLTAVCEGRIQAELLDQAVLRVLRWKQELNLL